MTKQHKQELEDAKILKASWKNKRINTNAKGRRSETKTAQWLQRHGWVVETTRRSSYRGGSNDFFNLFDHVAVCEAETTYVQRRKKTKKETIMTGKEFFSQGTTLFIQTKSNRVTKKVEQKICDFPARNKAIFVWHDNITEPEIRLYLERYVS